MVILLLAVILVLIIPFNYLDPPEPPIENQLIIYGAANFDDVKPLLDAFEAKYPEVKVEYITNGPPILYTRLMGEILDEQPTADVVMLTLRYQLALTDGGYLEAYKTPESSSYPSNLKDADGFWTAAQLNPVIQVYNPQSLSQDDLPKTIDDLVDPKWIGEVTIHDVTLGTVGTIWLASLKSTMGDKWTSFVEELAKLDPARFGPPGLVGSAVSGGGFDIGLTVYLHDFLRIKAEGEPIERLNVEGLPVLYTISPVSITKNATNQVAAKRFVDFILSEEGQKIIDNSETRISARPNIDAQKTLTKLFPEEEFIQFPTDDAYLNANSYRDYFITLFRSQEL
tara:strand:+ start:512 stop:1531 length:1020 start_codon:yes stop_codon:yes gene_type:complete